MPFARICSAACAALLLGTGCAGSELFLPNDGGKNAIRVVDGNGQEGEVGALLSAPVVVQVTDGSGEPVANATVQFMLTSAGEGGEILPDSTTTDPTGQAKAYVVLGDKIGAQTGEAHLVINGATASKATFAAVASAPDPENRPPDADFNWHCDDLSCQFTDASSDPEGTVTVWSWQFGDGAETDQTNPAHVYAEPGSYTVTLVVTDNDGSTDQTSTDVNVTAPPPQENEPPHADFKVHCHDQFCSFSDQSRDDDGAVVSWTWDFGDGTGSGERSPFHFYREEGKYDVTLTVTDDDGGSDSKTHHADAKD